MKRFWIALHILLGLGWLSTALALGVKTALLGNEQAALAKQRGDDLRRRYDLAPRANHLRSAIDGYASRPVLDGAVRRLGLPLADPERPVSRPATNPPR